VTQKQNRILKGGRDVHPFSLARGSFVADEFLNQYRYCKTTVILSGFLKITRPTGVVSSAAPTDFGACEVWRDQGGGALGSSR
jgi:hypothetical protein